MPSEWAANICLRKTHVSAHDAGLKQIGTVAKESTDAGSHLPVSENFYGW